MSPVIEHLPAGAGPLAAAPLKRAFVISESRHLYTLARSLLNAAGVQDVGFSSDTRSAEIRMPGFEPDLIVADWPDNLPGHQDRIGLLRRLRTHSETGLQEKPVILLTPPRTQSRVEQARDAGATELLVMPVSMSQFSQRVTSLARRPRAFVSSPRFTGHCRRRRRAAARVVVQVHMLGSLHPGAKISLLIVREALGPHWYLFPVLAHRHKLDHLGTLVLQC